MKCISFITVPFIIFFASTIHASTPPLTKLVCPSVSAITSTGVNIVQQDKNHLWVAAQLKNKFDTDVEWDFAIGWFNANGEEDALEQANASLSELKATVGPIGSGDHLLCGYQTDSGYFAGAITPSDANPVSILKHMR